MQKLLVELEINKLLDRKLRDEVISCVFPVSCDSDLSASKLAIDAKFIDLLGPRYYKSLRSQLLNAYTKKEIIVAGRSRFREIANEKPTEVKRKRAVRQRRSHHKLDGSTDTELKDLIEKYLDVAYATT